MPNSRSRDKIIRDFAPDVIHVHNEFAISLFGMNYAKKNRIPAVYTLHTMYADYFSYVAKNQLEESVVKDIFSAYLRGFVSNADVIMSPSPKAVSFLHDNNITQKDVIVMPNAIDTAAFDPSRFPEETVLSKKKELGISEGDFTGVFVGRLGYEKSVDYLIDFWCGRLKSKPHFKLLVVGDGPEHDKLKKQAQILGVDDRVIFAGRVEHEDIPLYLACGDYYISASLTEMMSISMLEAMASGLCAVLRYDKANAAQVTEGENGYFFHDENELYALLEKLYEMSPEQRAELKRSARDSMLRRNADSAADEILEIYRKSIEEKKKEN